MRRCRYLGLVAFLALVVASCGDEREVAATSSDRPVAARSGESCPTTRQPKPPFIPPKPYPDKPPSLYDKAWYGTNRLWTWLRADGTWPMAHDRGTYYDKSFWWRQSPERPTETEPTLRITGRRLDAPAPEVTSSDTTNGSRHDIGEFMLGMVELPDRGCWEITGRVGAETLSFVVRVTAGRASRRHLVQVVGPMRPTAALTPTGCRGTIVVDQFMGRCRP
jgi:hypothetical protein